jgi:hypothetical protein
MQQAIKSLEGEVNSQKQKTKFLMGLHNNNRVQSRSKSPASNQEN